MDALKRTRIAGLVLALLGAAPAILGAAPALAAPPLEVGQPFPDLVLPALDDGRPLSIGDLRGKKVVLLVFASW